MPLSSFSLWKIKFLETQIHNILVMLWVSKYGIRRCEFIHHLQVSFLFRYGIDVKCHSYPDQVV